MVYKLPILVLICIYLFSACKNNTGCKKISISQDEKKWLDFFNIGDSILFKSNFDNIDTFIVHDVQNDFYSSCNKFELGENQYESQSVSLKLLNKIKVEKTKQENVWFSFSKDVNNMRDSSSQKYFKVFDFETKWFSDLNQLDSDTINLSTTSKTYHTYVFDRSGTNQNPDGSPAIIKTFWWSKYFGLLRYETSQGEVFELQR